MSLNDAELLRRIHADVEHSYDDDLDLELEDRNVDAVAATLSSAAAGPDRGARRRCLRELFRLQRELVKLQDRVQHSGHEVVVLFVGHGAPGRTAPRQEAMLERTHIAEAPGSVVSADDKKRARLNCIAHLLAQMPHADLQREAVVLPLRGRH